MLQLFWKACALWVVYCLYQLSLSLSAAGITCVTAFFVPELRDCSRHVDQWPHCYIKERSQSACSSCSRCPTLDGTCRWCGAAKQHQKLSAWTQMVVFISAEGASVCANADLGQQLALWNISAHANCCCLTVLCQLACHHPTFYRFQTCISSYRACFCILGFRQSTAVLL
jgi:hypothetical protein